MPAAYPKPDGQKVHRNPVKFDWQTLPAEGRSGPAPKLPPLRRWRKTTRDAWARQWAKPQAVMWDQTGDTMMRWAILSDMLAAGEGTAPALSAELRQIEDRHGLNPKAMLQLRWRIAADEAAAETSTGKPASVSRLHVVDG